jgi:hypothetical protein
MFNTEMERSTKLLVDVMRIREVRNAMSNMLDFDSQWSLSVTLALMKKFREDFGC